MPIHEVLAEALGSIMKTYPYIDGTHQKQAYALIRTCRRIQLNYQNSKDVLKSLAVLKKVESTLHSFSKLDKDSKKLAKNATVPINMTLDDFQDLYGSSEEATAEWRQFSTELEDAARYDESRRAKLHTLKVIRKKSAEWPSDSTSSVNMEIIFPSMFYDKSRLSRQRLQLHRDSTFEEVIWIFSRLRDGRISLQQNMQFYGEDINKKFQSLDPVNSPSSASKQTYYVLVDRPVRILFDLRKPRIFGNMWDLGGSRIILKEFNGKLMESEIIRRDIPVNTFHVNSKTSRRLNWKYAMDLALKDLARIEERHQGEDFPIYKIQSAEPEPSPSSSVRSSYHECEDDSDDSEDVEHQPATADHLPTTAQAHVVLTQHGPKFPAPSQVTLTNMHTAMPTPVTFPQSQAQPYGTHSIRGPAILPSKPTQQVNSISTSHVTAATQAWGAPSPQPPPPQSSAPPPKRGWVRRMIDRFTGK